MYRPTVVYRREYCPSWNAILIMSHKWNAYCSEWNAYRPKFPTWFLCSSRWQRIYDTLFSIVQQRHSPTLEESVKCKIVEYIRYYLLTPSKGMDWRLKLLGWKKIARSLACKIAKGLKLDFTWVSHGKLNCFIMIIIQTTHLRIF